MAYTARYWSRNENGQVICHLCPRQCCLRDGQRGFCFVRQNIDGQLVLTTYGRSSGFCVDPIEKKPLYHFLPGSRVLSFGTAGCNLGCRFCQNWELSRCRDSERLTEEASADMIARRAVELDCASVAFTYNEPVIFTEYAVDAARACQQQGVKTVAVTAGYVCGQAREDFFSVMDAANVDLKAFSEEFYRDVCAGSLAPVLDTLKFLKNETDVWLEITTLLIPSLNDSPEEIDAMTRWIRDQLGVDVPLHLTAFHPDYHVRNLPRTPLAVLRSARDIAFKNGLRHVYTGNVIDPEGSATFCSQCRRLLIQREGFRLTEYHLKDGNRCSSCGEQCAGCFGPAPMR